MESLYVVRNLIKWYQLVGEVLPGINKTICDITYSNKWYHILISLIRIDIIINSIEELLSQIHIGDTEFSKRLNNMYLKYKLLCNLMTINRESCLIWKHTKGL